MRILHGERLSGIIIETEAYRGEEDLACHARAGRTPRTKVMYGPPGFAYIYFNYGIHWLFNFVAGPVNHPAAVLLRAIHPMESIEIIARHRAGQKPKNWCNGPAKICQAFAINGSLNGHPLCSKNSEIWIEDGEPVPENLIQAGPRVGIQNVPEPWRSKPWRYIAHMPFDH